MTTKETYINLWSDFAHSLIVEVLDNETVKAITKDEADFAEHREELDAITFDSADFRVDLFENEALDSSHLFALLTHAIRPLPMVFASTQPEILGHRDLSHAAHDHPNSICIATIALWYEDFLASVESEYTTFAEKLEGFYHYDFAWVVTEYHLVLEEDALIFIPSHYCNHCS